MNGAAIPDLKLAQTFFERVASHPDRDAIVTEETTVSYAQLADRIAAVGAWLIDVGASPDECVGVSIGNEQDHLAVALALMFLGVPQLTLPLHQTAANRRGLAQRTGARIAITDGPADTENDAVRYVRFDAAIYARGAKAGRDRWHAFEPDDNAIYRATSGTTGRPKVFGITAQRLQAVAERHASDPSQARVLRTSTMDFDSSKIYRIAAILAGNSCMFLDGLMPDRLARFCAEANVSEVQMGPEKLKGLVRHRGSVRLPSSTRILVGGARVPGSLRREASALTDSLWVSYATSEVGVVSFASPDQHEAFPEGVGDPIPGVTVEILTEAGEPVAPGEVGVARIAKKAIPGAYLDGPDGGTSLAEGWFYSHDLLSWPQGGPLIFHGRADDVMMLNGIKIFPSAIEDALEAHPDVTEAVAYPIKSDVHGDIPVAAVTVRDDAAASGDDFVRLCRDTLGISYPRRVFVVDAIPRTDNGKPMRRLLPAG
jgi:long-chain acyl-CoA synthetase